MVVGRAKRSQMLKGLLDPCLLAVTDQQPRYGYEVVRCLADAGLADVAEGSVYPALTRLERAGLLRADRISSAEGPPRKYYRSTAAGKAHLEEWLTEWIELSTSVDIVLGIPARSGSMKEKGA